MSTDAIARLSASLADDRPVDWQEALDRAATAEERRVIDQMRVLASLAAAHRAHDLLDQSASASVGTAPPSDVPSPIGRWGHLDLLEILGHGTTSIVYRAWDRRLARQVALKLYASRGSDTQNLDEARHLARVRHPSVVTVFGADRIDDHVGIWMELLEGRTLEQILTADGPFSAREALSIGQDVCGALAAVHQAGLLHRDVKAQNIMRERGGRIVLMDFGAGRRHTAKDAPGIVDFSGTPLYMAPELFERRAATAASDLYSLGVLLFRLVTGQYPVEATTLAEVLCAHADGTRRSLHDLRPELSTAFVQVVEKALDGRPEGRFDSAGAMARALAGIATAQPSSSASGPAAGADGGHDKRPSRQMAPAMVLTALGTALLMLSIEHGPRALRARWATAAPPAITPSLVASEPPDAPAVGMSEDQRTLVAGFEELAGTLGSKGEWDRAAGVYDQIRNIHRDTIGEFAPVSGLNIARSAWARHRAGRLDDARYLYEEAVVKLETMVGKVHPHLATTHAALAMLHWQAGRVDDAQSWLQRALTVRRQILGVAVGDAAQLTLPSSREATVTGGSGGRVVEDGDGDGLYPLIEAALGLDPTRADSDGDGTGDGDEIDPASGVSTCLLYCLSVDPTKVIAHFGSINPRREGFFRHYPIEGSVVDQADRWSMRTGPLGYYFQKLTTTQKAAAVASGWRLLLRGRALDGVAYALVDLTPLTSRWDINLVLRRPSELVAHLTTSVIPVQGAEVLIDEPESFPLLELVWLPATQRVSYYVNGVQRAAVHPGTTQFQDDRGVIFGAGNRGDQGTSGHAEFQLVWLDIR